MQDYLFPAIKHILLLYSKPLPCSKAVSMALLSKLKSLHLNLSYFLKHLEKAFQTHFFLQETKHKQMDLFYLYIQSLQQLKLFDKKHTTEQFFLYALCIHPEQILQKHAKLNFHILDSW